MSDNWDEEISGGGTSTNNQTTEDNNNNTIKSESKFGGFGARDNNNNFNKGFRSNERVSELIYLILQNKLFF
jgi:hypothetical protein